MPSSNTSADAARARFTVKVILVCASRAAVWSLLAAGLLALVVTARTSMEFRPGLAHGMTWGALFWLLTFFPALAMELGRKYLQFELE